MDKIGYYNGKVKGKIVFKCTGTDGNSVTKTLSLDGSAVAVFPQVPKEPWVKRQKVTTSKLE